jgi:uncharacterized protein (DUF3084 family)
MTSLYEISTQYQQAFLALAEIEDGNEQLVADTLEGIEGEFSLKATNVTAYLLNLDAEAELIKQAEERCKARRKAIEARAESLRAYLLRNMSACGITEIKATDGSFRARLMAGRESVVIDDDQQLPGEYLRVKHIVEPDKTAILRAFKSGEQIPGAHIERKPSLKID